jgi:hypothetical protein
MRKREKIEEKERNRELRRERLLAISHRMLRSIP